jgi:hypothetical protein
VCEECDERAVNADGDTLWTSNPPEKQSEEDISAIVDPHSDGENPVFIDGHKCWRRYRFGGWKTYIDFYDCDTLREFYVRHGLMEPQGSHSRAAPDSQSADESQGENSTYSSTEDQGAAREDTISASELDQEYSEAELEKLRDIIIQGAKISSDFGTAHNEIQQIASLISNSQWSSLAARYLVLVAKDEPETALEALPTVASSYTTADTETRRWVMYYFARLSETHPNVLLPVLDTLVEGISEDDINIQSNALATLGRIVSVYPNVGSGLVDEVAKLLIHKKAEVRRNAVGILGDIAQEYPQHVAIHIPMLATCLGDSEALVRRNASITLVRCGEADADAIREQSDLIEDALTDDQPEVRKNACVLVGNATPPVSPDQVERLATTDPDPDVQKIAQWALNQIIS